MEGFITAVGILGLFVLRLGIPLLIVIGVGYWLRRLDAKWEAEAHSAARSTVTKVEVDLRPVEQPCWVLKKCPEPVYTHCPAFLNSAQPCWLARSRAEGMLPNKCFQCVLFSQRRPVHELAT
ncbi:MAG: hypothetical protein KF893_21090 [Caldilineaceae bacterium]|nr:hypothetical protein [Caldilineaceae bacterium]